MSDRALVQRWQRLTGRDRSGGVDLARGLAVIGMFAAHLLVTPPRWEWAEPGTWTTIVNGRSSILFALLAGVSIGLVTGREHPLASAAMGTARARLAVRAGALFVIGLLLIVTGVPVYVILPAYAILFLLALPLTRLHAPALFTIAGVTGLVMPFVQPVLDALPVWDEPYGQALAAVLGWNYPFTVWFAFLACGMGLARSGIGRWAVQVRMLLTGAALAALGYSLVALPAPEGEYFSAVWTARPHSSGVLEVIGSGGFALAVLAACLLLCRTPGGWVVLPLRATGAMPLSVYTAQLLIWAVLAAAWLGDTGDLSGFRALDPFWPLTIGTIIGCTLWALLIGRGPWEWMLGGLSRMLIPAGGNPRHPGDKLDG